MPRLIALELENFQSIVDSTRIEFAPITLMYGPNSAGKSAIFDALHFVQLFWDQHSHHADELTALSKRWAHKPLQWEASTDRRMRIAVEFDFDSTDPYESWGENAALQLPESHVAESPYFGGEDFIYEISQLPNKIVRLEVGLIVAEAEVNIEVLKIEIGGRSILLCGRSLPNGLTRNNIDFAPRNQHYIAFASGHPFDNFLYAESEIRTLLENDDPLKYSGLFTYEEVHYAYVLGAFDQLNPRKIIYDHIDAHLGNSSLKTATCEKIITSTKEILAFLGGQLSTLLKTSPPIVRDDRTIPSNAESEYSVNLYNFVDAWGHPKRTSRYQLNQPNQQTSNSSHFEYLALLTHCGLIERSIDVAGGWHRDADEFKANFQEKLTHLQLINEYLDGHLFIDKAYHLTAESKILSTLTHTSPFALEEPDIYASAFVKLLLLDNESRVLELRDVGSGIPFLLPILSALVRDGITKVQQPELHLHPRLQAAMADIFVDRMSSDKNWQAIIETHSENFLLRLLKKVRSTGQGKQQLSTLTPDDVAIYYFDPQMAGGTIVTKQLLTPLGDFYSEWPKGFFSERYEDLFDE
jgi:predicted ATPase